jgi:TPP-dependent indolepyruvate ferredoxin oxidoreductase alpha subunit
MNEYVTKFT